MQLARERPCLPVANARTMCATSRGMTFDATLMTPCAPTAMNGSVSESSPLRMVNFVAERRAQLRHAIRIAARFLDADDVHAVMREAVHRVHADLDAATARECCRA